MREKKNLQTSSNKQTLVKVVDFGEKSDCSELESKSEDESHPRTNTEPKVSVQEEIKEKGGVET